MRVHAAGGVELGKAVFGDTSGASAAWQGILAAGMGFGTVHSFEELARELFVVGGVLGIV